MKKPNRKKIRPSRKPKPTAVKKVAKKPVRKSAPSENKPTTRQTPPSAIAYLGRSRAVIDRVEPVIDGGEFPIKRIIGDIVEVCADVFADGHDALGAALQYRLKGERDWEEQAMRFEQNDLWEAEFVVEEEGFYEYRIAGWVDHMETWFDGVRKKIEQGQDVAVDIQIGSDLLKEAAKRAPNDDKFHLKQWAEDMLRDEEVALSPLVRETALKYPDRSQEAVSKTYSVLVERERAGFSAWYEIFPRSWASEPGVHGTFRDCERILPEIARMGFNVVYLPPVHPIGQTKRKGKNNALTAEPDDVGSPWAIGSKHGGHKSVHPELGTFEDFRHFVKQTSKHGMEVALDIAFQCSPDHPYVKEHPQWFRWWPDGTVQFAENPPKKYEDILPFNFETEDWEALWKELRSVFFFWIEQGVKIFRVDNPHTKPLEFWRWVIHEIKAKHPDVLFLAEAFTRPKLKYRLGKAGFTHGYTYFTWRNTKEELTSYLTELTQTEVKEFFRPNFWPNTPDILHETLQHGGRPAFLTRLALAATLSANYGIYGPAYELCLNQANPPAKPEEYIDSEKYELKQWDWDAPGNLKDFITQINRIRRDQPALQRTNNLTFVQTDNPVLIAYLKKSAEFDNTVLTIVNLDPYHTQSGWLMMNAEELGMDINRPYWANDLLSGEKYLWQGERNFIKLDPHLNPVHIFLLSRERYKEQHFDYYL